jgi:hypothetical protein
MDGWGEMGWGEMWRGGKCEFGNQDYVETKVDKKPRNDLRMPKIS